MGERDQFVKDCLKLADELLDPCCGKQPSIELENNYLNAVFLGKVRLIVHCDECHKEAISTTGTPDLLTKWNGREPVFNEDDKVTVRVGGPSYGLI